MRHEKWTKWGEDLMRKSSSKYSCWFVYALDIFSVLGGVKEICEIFWFGNFSQFEAVHFTLDVGDDPHVVCMDLPLPEHGSYLRIWITGDVLNVVESESFGGPELFWDWFLRIVIFSEDSWDLFMVGWDGKLSGFVHGLRWVLVLKYY